MRQYWILLGLLMGAEMASGDPAFYFGPNRSVVKVSFTVALPRRTFVPTRYFKAIARHQAAAKAPEQIIEMLRHSLLPNRHFLVFATTMAATKVVQQREEAGEKFSLLRTDTWFDFQSFFLAEHASMMTPSPMLAYRLSILDHNKKEMAHLEGTRDDFDLVHLPTGYLVVMLKKPLAQSIAANVHGRFFTVEITLKTAVEDDNRTVQLESGVARSLLRMSRPGPFTAACRYWLSRLRKK